MSATNNDLFRAWLIQQLPAGILDSSTVQPNPGGGALNNSQGSFNLITGPGSNFARVSLAAGSSGVVTGSTGDFGAIAANPCAVITATAILTAGAFTIEGSLDNNNWFPLTAAPIANTDFSSGKLVNQYAFAGHPCRSVRVNITTALTGGTVSAMVAAGG